MNQIWCSVSIESCLKQMDFWLPHADCKVPQEEVVMMEDERAAEAGHFALALVYHRLLRTLDTSIGYPASFIRLLADNPKFDLAVATMKNDMDAFQKLRAIHKTMPGLDVFWNRHLFHRLVNTQMFAALDESKWKVAGTSVEKHIKAHFSRLQSTQLIYDAFNHQKITR